MRTVGRVGTPREPRVLSGVLVPVRIVLLR